jgi:NADPH:quinone reductase-like Zn-dependent oxidoreductase
MRALTVVLLQEGSAAVVDVDEPEPGPGELLVDGIALGVCGTDREIVAGEYGWAPAGQERLILGHESLGRVRTAPSESGFASGDLVVGVVRRPDPDPCPACARGEFDMRRNGRYTERGIKELNGYGPERWAVEADYAALLAANAFVVFFGMSWGPVVWVLLGEMFPNRIRAIALSVAATANWLANFAVSTSFPALQDVGLGIAYGIYTAAAACSVLFVLFLVPETKGKELEEM